MTPEQLQQYEFSYISKKLMLLFTDEPNLETIDEVRQVLDILTDGLIQKQLSTEHETTLLPNRSHPINL